MQTITQISGTGVPLFLDDIDTDRIIPARYLRCVTFDGLGEHAFEDDRKQDLKHPFNQERFRSATVLISGRNFGCGSSREHAPQSLMRWGIKAVIAESFAEIFFGNCTSLGVPAMTATRTDLAEMAAAVEQDPTLPMTVDLQLLQVAVGGKSYAVHMPTNVRDSLVTGQWDFLGQLLDNQTGIRQTAATIPYLNKFAGVSRV